MKLLLDAPEYLWRLIERKKYMHASWLFLLSRVAHRGLVSQDEMDDQSWRSEGIDVLVSRDILIPPFNSVLTVVGRVPSSTTSMGCYIPIPCSDHTQINIIIERDHDVLRG